VNGQPHEVTFIQPFKAMSVCRLQGKEQMDNPQVKNNWSV